MPFGTTGMSDSADPRACPLCGAASHRPRFSVDEFLIIKCTSCSLVYLANPPDETRLYDEYYNTEPNRNDPQRDAIMAARAGYLHQLNPGLRLLDIGCGPGWFISAAKSSGFDVHGVDVAAGAVAYATEHLNVHATTETVQELVHQKREYDVVTLWHVLEHFYDPVAELKQIRELLSPDGLIAIEVPNLNSLKFRLSASPWQGGNHPLYHRTFFTAQTLSRIIEKAGYHSVQIRRLNYTLPGRSAILEATKRVLNHVGLDSFIFVTARN